MKDDLKKMLFVIPEFVGIKVNKKIEEDNIEKNNDEKASDSFLKIDPIKSLDSSNIKIEMPKK